MTAWFEILMVALLPITALITVLQQRPYYALISRGIMGVVAVMIYAAFGAADVALTEALVGTLLTVLLFAITLPLAIYLLLCIAAPMLLYLFFLPVFVMIMLAKFISRSFKNIYPADSIFLSSSFQSLNTHLLQNHCISFLKTQYC